MDNIVRLTPMQILALAENLTRADLNGKSVRVCTGRDEKGHTWFKIDSGHGWSPPVYGLPY